MSTSLLEILKSKFLEHIRSVDPPGKWKILVVDEHSQRLLSSVLKTYDILAENVTLIEAINSHRTVQTQEAMYLLTSTTANVERIIADFSDGRKQYGGAHVFFLDGLEESLCQRLLASPAAPHLKQLVDIFLNLNPSEARYFNLNIPSMFFSFYSPPRDPTKLRTRLKKLDCDLRFVAKTLLNLCITLNENPLIRYYQAPNHGPLGPLLESQPPGVPVPPPTTEPIQTGLRWARAAVTRDSSANVTVPSGDQLPKKLAFILQSELDDYRSSNPEWPKPDGTNRPRGTIIITDRTMDTIVPFIHEFTYQAMANDLLRIENGRAYSYKFQTAVGKYENQTAVLSDADTVWTQVRHMHMGEAIERLRSDFNQFLQEHAGFKGGEGATTLNDMKDMLASLPQYQEMREKFSLHLTMAQECMDIFEKRDLKKIANVEQQCATGETVEGKTPKKLVEEMVPLLYDPQVSNRDKVRIIALYLMHRDGAPEEDLRRLFQHAKLHLSEQDAIRSLVKLGVRLYRGPGDKDTRKVKFKPIKSDDEYELSRYKPLLQHMLTEHVASTLDQTAFPYVRDGPTSLASSLAVQETRIRVPSVTSASSGSSAGPTSLRSGKRTWNRQPRTVAAAGGSAAPEKEKEPVRQRIIVFVAGGLTYPELRVAYEVGSNLNRDIYIGSTHSITPEGFVDDLKVLEIEGVGSAALPNGLPNVSPAEYQDFYDKKYFTPDPPPLKPTHTAAGGGHRPALLNNGKNGGLQPPAFPSPANSMSSGRSGNVHKERKEKEEKDKDKDKKKGSFISNRRPGVRLLGFEFHSRCLF
ncbi:Sec1-like snare protein [Cantharellus anzutake]|uniref:Sec1-like snare protein n=1 Tax=Cantharellus anzutake TaxID=1750568 RepID=UPI0019061F34|nr:Sec1-like snare protein [Cantharellus anzutake]KAF8317774.1 Sec1-like snare protein [Cantharellus anzutake]